VAVRKLGIGAGCWKIVDFVDFSVALMHECPGCGLVVLPALQNQRICRVPNKHHVKRRRHHTAKMEYSTRNWREYAADFRARGGRNMWVTPDAMALRVTQPRSPLGGQTFYSDLGKLCITPHKLCPQTCHLL
jgi:hypothetical protein